MKAISTTRHLALVAAGALMLGACLTDVGPGSDFDEAYDPELTQEEAADGESPTIEKVTGECRGCPSGGGLYDDAIDARPPIYPGVTATSALRSAGDRFRPYLLNAQWMGDVFRAGYSRTAAAGLAAKIDRGDYSWLPAVELFDETYSGAYIGGRRIYDAGTRQPTALMGAYKGGKVYWNRRLTGSGIPAATIRSVAVQELAHHIDSIVNPNGARIGGEGVIAVAKLFGPTLSAEQITGLQSYRDHADIFVNGRIVTDVELGFWRNVAIAGAVIVVVVVVAVAVSVLAPEVLVLGSSAFGGALPVAAAEADATALAAVAAGEQTSTVAAAVNTERTALLGVRSAGALTRSTRVWGNLDQTAQIVNRFRVFRVGNVARNVNVGRLDGLVSSRSGALSLREAAIEDISGSPFSQGWGIVSRDLNLINIYRQVAVEYSFAPGL